MKDTIFKNFFLGINYWGSKSAIHMWSEYDEASVEKDMQLLRDAGITVLRVFPSWPDFQPLTAFCAPGGVYEYGMHGKVCPDTEAGRAGVSEEMCQHFEHFCETADKYGMKIMVGMLTGHMSFANLIPPALVNVNLLTDAVAIKWELKYIKYFVKRMKKIPNIIAWDLGNEVNNLCDNNTEEEFCVWSNMLSDAIKASDSTRPVLSGVGGFSVAKGLPNLKDMAEACDYNTVHGYNIFDTEADPVNTMKAIMDYMFKCRLSEDITGMPTFVQEFGAIGYANCSLESEAEFYRATALSILSHGFHGVMYWCAFDQGHFTFPPYNWNNIGSDYGFFDKDLQAKPLVRENLRIKELVDQIGKLPDYKRDCTILVPREEDGEHFGILRAAYMLTERIGIDAGFSYAVDPIPDSQVYILPSLEFNKPITNVRLMELLDKVEKGSVLYISLGASLFRRMNELAGVVLDNKRDVSKQKTMFYQNAELPIIVDSQYKVTEDGCQVLAVDEQNQPIFVKNRYGEGYIYVLFAPLEKYLANSPGAFYEEDVPDYESIYRELAGHLTDNRIIKCNSRFIRTTEHILSENERYIFAINYSNREQVAQLEIPKGYELKVIWGNSYQDGKVKLAPCDGILLHGMSMK